MAMVSIDFCGLWRVRARSEHGLQENMYWVCVLRPVRGMTVLKYAVSSS